MARGLVSGMVAGGVVGGALLATASLLAPLSPERQAPLLVPEPNGSPSAPAPAPAAASGGAAIAPAAPPAAASEPDLPDPAPPAPPGAVATPPAEPSAPERSGGLTPAARNVVAAAASGVPAAAAPAPVATPVPEAPPAAGAAETAPPLPAVPAPAPVAEPAKLAMPVAAPEKAAPRAPAATETARLSGAPSAPRPAASEPAPEALSEPAPEPAAVAAPVAVTAPAPLAEAEAPASAPEAAPAPAPVPDFAAAAPAPEPAPVAPATPEAERLPAETAAAPEPAPEPETLGERDLAAEAETALQGDVESARARIIRGTGTNNLVPNVRVNRLPTISGPVAAEAAEAADAAGTPAEEVVPEAEADLPALRRFAEPFENEAGKPLLSILLIDIGVAAGGLDLPAARSFPFPVTIAVPADRPGAAELAATYRQSGIEVVLMASGLPAGARPSDLEVAFEVYRATIPEAVAVLDPPEGGFQGNRAQAAQAVEILQAAGLGLLALDRGLNAGIQLAERAGLPAALIFRDLDAAGEDPAAIRRTLDRAVFRAGQDGRVVVLARSTPRMAATLFSWALEGRAESVALAPVSAVLLGM